MSDNPPVVSDKVISDSQKLKRRNRVFLITKSAVNFNYNMSSASSKENIKIVSKVSSDCQYLTQPLCKTKTK